MRRRKAERRMWEDELWKAIFGDEIDPNAIAYILNISDEVVESYTIADLLKEIRRFFGFIEKGNMDAAADLLDLKWRELPHGVKFEDGIFKPVAWVSERYDKFWWNFIRKVMVDDWAFRFDRCRYCGRWFFKTKSNRIYCSDSCRGTHISIIRYHREKKLRDAGVVV